MLPEGMLPKVSPLKLRLALLRDLQTPLAVLPGSRDKGITDLSVYEFRRDQRKTEYN